MSTSDISTFFLSWMIVADVVHGILFLLAIKYILDAFHYISNDPTMQRRVGAPGINGGPPMITHKIPKTQLFMQKLRWITVLLIFLRIIFITVCGFKNGELYYESDSTSTSELIFDVCYWILEEATAEGRFIIIIVIFLRMTEILMQLYNIEFNGRLLPILKEKSQLKQTNSHWRLTKFCFGTKSDNDKSNNLIKSDTSYKDIQSKLRVLNIIKSTSIVAIFLDAIRRVIDGILWLTNNANVHLLWQIILSVVIHTLFYIAFVTFVICTFVVYYKANKHYKKMKALSDLQEIMKEAEKQIDQVKFDNNENNENNDNIIDNGSEFGDEPSSMNSKITQQTANTVNTMNTMNTINTNFSINNNNSNNFIMAAQLPAPINIQLLAKEDKKRQIRETIVRLRRISPLFLMWCLFYVYYDSVDIYRRWFVGNDESNSLKLLFRINLYWIYWGVCDTILYIAIIYYLKPIETTHMRKQWMRCIIICPKILLP